MTTLRALAKLACTLVLGVACRGGARDSGAPAARALASTGPAVSAPAAPALAVGDPARGHELVVAYQCSRCHEGSGTPAPGREQHCVTCHQDIEQGKLHAPAAVLARWRPHVAPVDAVPSLVAAGRRLRADWLRAFLLEPSDVRPALAPTMPRLALSAAQAADIAAYLASLGAPAPPSAAAPALGPALVAEGRRIAATRGCASCHAFSGLDGWPTPHGDALPLRLAPDLRHARERLNASVVAEFVQNPSAVKADAVMPVLGLSAEEAQALAVFVLEVPLGPLPERVPPRALPLLDRPVRFAEVNARVFAVTCRHCHANPDSVLGDGGPGSSGGFGFAARHIEFGSHEGIMSGGLNRQGERQSLFAPTADGTPWLVAALRARQDEEAGRPRDGIRGMPLGLPALTAEDIQLVETWISQGRPL